MAKRRRKIRRKKHSKRILIMLLLIVVSVVLIGFLRSDYFTIAEITVEGNTYITSEEILSGVSFREGDQMFSFNASKQEKLLEQIPRAKNVSIVRIYPDKIKIVVTEREPMAVIFYGGMYYSVDSDAKVFSKSTGLEVSKGIIISGLSEIEIQEEADFDFYQNVKTQTAYQVIEFLQNKNIFSYISEIHIKEKAYYLYTRKANVVKFYSYSAFEANEDFLFDFISKSDMQVMVEVLEGTNPVYKVIDIQ